MWRFCGKTQFPQSFLRITQNPAETVHCQKIPTPGNQVELRYFRQFTRRLLKKHRLCSPIFFQSEGAKYIVQKCFMSESKFKCLLALKRDNRDKLYHSVFQTQIAAKMQVSIKYTEMFLMVFVSVSGSNASLICRVKTYIKL